MKYLLFTITIIVAACNTSIKEQKSVKENPLADSLRAKADVRPEANKNTVVLEPADLIGYWVGWFIADLSDTEKQALFDNNITYSDRNKINISIDSISGTYVKGHSVVANNNTPFEGEVDFKADISYVGARQTRATPRRGRGRRHCAAQGERRDAQRGGAPRRARVHRASRIGVLGRGENSRG